MDILSLIFNGMIIFMALIGYILLGVLVIYKPDIAQESHGKRLLFFIISPFYMLYYGIKKILDKMPISLKKIVFLVTTIAIAYGVVHYTQELITDKDDLITILAIYFIGMVVCILCVCMECGCNDMTPALQLVISLVSIWPITIALLIVYYFVKLTLGILDIAVPSDN